MVEESAGAVQVQQGDKMTEHEELELLRAILDAYPYPVVFVDDGFIIRYMNRNARYHYCEERGYADLIGASLLDCHNEASAARVRAAWEGIKRNGKEVFVGVSARNQRIYMQGVRDARGRWIGFFERFELNQQR